MKKHVLIKHPSMLLISVSCELLHQLLPHETFSDGFFKYIWFQMTKKATSNLNYLYTHCFQDVLNDLLVSFETNAY